MQNQKVVNEVLGAKLLENGDGSYTIIFPDQSSWSFGHTLTFQDWQADNVFYESVDMYLSRDDHKYRA